jgi:GNAT superfamily N-acetyltransferase
LTAPDAVRIDVLAEPLATLAEYAHVPIAFEVRSTLDCTAPGGGLGGLLLSERDVAVPYRKDYDAIAGEGPARWARRFDVSNWGVLAARVNGERVGGAVIAFDTPGVEMLEGRRDLAVLWDLRVAPAARGRGVGTALFAAAARWAAARGCGWLKVETQNVNVPACRFYARRGCTLGAINRFAYHEFPDEIQLLWYKELSGRGPDAPPPGATGRLVRPPRASRPR